MFFKNYKFVYNALDKASPTKLLMYSRLSGHGTYKGDPNCASMDCVDLVLVLGSGFGVDFIL